MFSYWLYGALCYALVFSLHHVCALVMHISLCYYASLNACSDDHLLCYVIIIAISILFILYLSFYYLLYFEGLMCFVQVFQVTSIDVPSASQLLIILKGRNFKHFQFILFKFTFSILCFVPMCLCKLLGLMFLCIFCRLYGLYHVLCSLFILCCSHRFMFVYWTCILPYAIVLH